VQLLELVGKTQLAIERLLAGGQHVRPTPAAGSPYFVASLRLLRVLNGCDLPFVFAWQSKPMRRARPSWIAPLSMTFGTGGNAHRRAHSCPMDIILTIIWLASVTCVFTLIGIIGSHAERAMTPAYQH